MMNKKMYMTILNYDKNMSPTVKNGFEQLIHEHFDNQLTREELDFLIELVKPYEDELGMDISFLLAKLKYMKNMLPKEKGVVESVEYD